MAISLTLSDLFKSSFHATPHPYLLLNPDLRIIDANDCYLAATMTRRGDILQAGMFEVFPDNPDDPNASGVTNLNRSLVRVLDTGTLDRMALQRYDIRNTEGAFEERWWQPLNIPVFDEQGHLSTIVHYVEDVTEARHNGPGSEASPRDVESEDALAAAIDASLHEADGHFARQTALLEELKRQGHSTEIVESLLASLAQVLAGHRLYAQKLRRVSRSRTAGPDLHAEWSSAISVARSQLNRLDQLVAELRHSIASSRQTIEDSRTLATDPVEAGNPLHDSSGKGGGQ